MVNVVNNRYSGSVVSMINVRSGEIYYIIINKMRVKIILIYKVSVVLVINLWILFSL